jgi:ankyrin repeat protein
VALLAAGADANVKDKSGETSVWWAAYESTAEIMQLLINGGSSVNEPRNDGVTPLIALVANNNGDAAAPLGVLLERPELDLDAKYTGKTAEEWAVNDGQSQLASAIAQERARRKRWSALRSTWIAATIAPTWASCMV